MYVRTYAENPSFESESDFSSFLAVCRLADGNLVTLDMPTSIIHHHWTKLFWMPDICWLNFFSNLFQIGFNTALKMASVYFYVHNILLVQFRAVPEALWLKSSVLNLSQFGAHWEVGCVSHLALAFFYNIAKNAYCF